MKRFLVSIFLLLTFIGWSAYPPPVIRSKWTTNAVADGATGTNLTLYGMFYGNGGGLTNIPATGTNAFNTDQFINAGTGTIKPSALLTNILVYQTNYVENLTANSGANSISLVVSNNNGKIYNAHDSTWNYLQSITSSGSNSKDLLISGQSAGNIGLLQLNATTNMLLNGSLAWGATSRTPDVFLVREAANVLALRNGTNSQQLYIYNKYNNASDLERFLLYWTGDILYLRNQALGSGTQRSIVIDGATLNFQIGSNTKWAISSGFVFYPVNDGVYDIGASAYNVKSLYVSNIVAKGEVQANSLRVTNAVQLAITAGGSVTLGNHYTYLANTNLTTVTLPSAVGNSGKIYTIKAINPATSVTITNSTGAQTIDGALSYSLTASNKFVTVQSDNANWWIIGNN